MTILGRTLARVKSTGKKFDSREFAPETGSLTTGVFSTIAPPWVTSAKHGIRVIDLAETLCNFMPDRIPAISHMEELIVATARSIAGHTLRYGGLHVSNPDRRASLLYVPDSGVVLGRAPGARARGRRRWVGSARA